LIPKQESRVFLSLKQRTENVSKQEVSSESPPSAAVRIREQSNFIEISWLSLMRNPSAGSLPEAAIASYGHRLRMAEAPSQIRPSGPSICVRGKGRRERCLPLWKQTAANLRAWLAVRGGALAPELFLNARAQPMTRSGFEYVLCKHVRTAELPFQSPKSSYPSAAIIAAPVKSP
jgi:hypothetical protein